MISTEAQINTPCSIRVKEELPFLNKVLFILEAIYSFFF